jgi:alkylhydroperoxidase/carboxymuconolactone decarboxylase family protein YurZ
MSTPTRLSQLAPQIHQRYQEYFNLVFDEGPLDERGRAIAALAVALVLGNQATLQAFLLAAKQVGITNEDFGHMAAIADLVRIEAQQRANDTVAQTPAKKTTACC